ncbi:hypothetical protein RAM80_20965 [Pseudomonas sp. App30]|uniref:hypothetical protein n=1 Tax=Pseudomonas sp. App30 TaxID=3068990 RepID=UPI003A80B01F
MIKDIVEFLTPAQEPIQIVFFTVIALGVLVSVLLVSLKANAASWQRKWEGEELDATPSGLEVEHGSISELSQAVATPAEKLASMMPGLLLIVGLLGTFLGLGLALDKASSILQSSGSSVGAMDDSMQNLMAMMQGLGTKFKTSTWGIIAFILLKVWESWSGFEERRLKWCINKMKGELGQAREVRQQEKQASEERQHLSLMGSSQLIVDALAAQTAALNAAMEQQNLQARQIHKVWRQKFETVETGLGALQAGNKVLVNQAAKLNEAQVNVLNEGFAELQTLHQRSHAAAAEQHVAQVESLKERFAELQGLQQQLASHAEAEHVSRHDAHIEAMKQSFAELLTDYHTLALQAEQRDNAQLEALNVGFTGLQSSHQAAADRADEQQQAQSAAHIDALKQSFDNLMADNHTLAQQAEQRDNAHLEAMSVAFNGLQASNQAAADRANEQQQAQTETLTHGFASLEAGNQLLAQEAAARGATLLQAVEPIGAIASATRNTNEVLAGFTEKSRENQEAMQKAGETMSAAAVDVGSAASGLAAVVEDLNREMGAVLQSVKTDLNGVLTNMNQDFTQNLTAMAEQMGGATHKLSEIMESVKHDLGGTIQVMSEGFKDNMVGMASDLRSATDNISTSINGMSDNVNAAMQEVAKNMEHASAVQKATSVQFSTMSGALSENVTVMSNNMDAIGTSVSGGLESVSHSNQRIGKLASSFEKIATSLQELPQNLELVVKALGNSSNDVSSQLEGIHSTLTQSTRYANAADAIMKVPASIDELSTQLLKPKDEMLKVQQSLSQLLEVASGIHDNIHALKPAEVLQEA